MLFSSWRAFLFCGTAMLSALLAGGAPQERSAFAAADLAAYFGDYEGAFVLLDSQTGEYTRHNPERCEERFSPCSTFKIPNSLIFLETGVADGPEFPLEWDGTQHPFKPWNKDHTLRSAITVSALWYYQELAKRVGKERMEAWVERLNYGNEDISGGLTEFWLMSSLRISPNEQVEFLRRLHEGELPISERAKSIVLDILRVSETNEVIYRGKTGTGGDPVRKIATQGWWVGTISSPQSTYYFATLIAGGSNPSGRTARAITENILIDLGLLPATENP